MPPLLRRILMGLGAGILLALSFPPYGLPFLLPFGIAVLLVALRDAEVRSAAYTGFVCALAYFGGTLFWLANLFGAAAVSLVAIASIFPMLFAVLYVWLRQRLPLPEWLLTPIIWTACEYYRSEPFVLNFGWVGLGYGVANSWAWSILASWLGSYGVSFAIVLIAALLVRPTKNHGLPIGIAILWFVALYIPSPSVEPTNPLSVRLVQAFSDDTESLFAQSTNPKKEDAPPVSKTKLRGSAVMGLELHIPSPTIIVWPEYSILSDPTHDAKLWEKLRQVAITNSAYFLLGAKAIPDPRDDDKFRNTAYLLDPKGELVATHIKNHTVHFIKDGTPGTEAKAANTALGKLGIGICFDMDYPDVARRLAADGAEVFLIPNMDPAEWGNVQRAQHQLMFQMRAIENGRWLARADVAGGTSICAPNGKVIAKVDTADATVLNGIVGRIQQKTLYTQFGWRFGQLCLVLTGFGCLWRIAQARRGQ